MQIQSEDWKHVKAQVSLAHWPRLEDLRQGWGDTQTHMNKFAEDQWMSDGYLERRTAYLEEN